MKPINLIFDIKRDMHDYVELMQGYSYSFECEFYDDGIEFDLTGYNMSVDMLLANGDYDFRVSSKVVIGNKVTFNTDVISDYTGDANLQILLDKNSAYTGSWLVNCNVKPSVLNEVKNTDFVTDLKQTIQEGKDLYDKGGVATKQDIAEINKKMFEVETDIEKIMENNILHYGAIGDGKSHKLLDFYNSLESAKLKYPCAKSLDDEVDWCAIQTCIDFISELGGTVIVPTGKYVINKTIFLRAGVVLRGCGAFGLTCTQIFLRDNSNCSLLRTHLMEDYSDPIPYSNIGIKSISFHGNREKQTIETKGLELNTLYVGSWLRDVEVTMVYGIGIEMKYGADVNLKHVWIHHCASSTYAMTINGQEESNKPKISLSILEISSLYIENNVSTNTYFDPREYPEHRAKALKLVNAFGCLFNGYHVEACSTGIELQGNQSVIMTKTTSAHLGSATLGDSAFLKYLDNDNKIVTVMSHTTYNPHNDLLMIDCERGMDRSEYKCTDKSYKNISQYNYINGRYDSTGAITTTKNIDIYFDYETGDDLNDGSNLTPKKSVEFYINSLPSFINHTINLYLIKAPTIRTYVQNKEGVGSLNLIGFGDRQQINTVHVGNCTCNVTFYNFEFIGSEDNASVECVNCNYVGINNCTAVRYNKTFVYGSSANIHCEHNNVSNGSYVYHAGYFANLYCEQNTGSNNSYAFNSEKGSTIHSVNNNVLATSEYREYGGKYLKYLETIE